MINPARTGEPAPPRDRYLKNVIAAKVGFQFCQRRR
jgi:hypothetical protein